MTEACQTGLPQGRGTFRADAPGLRTGSRSGPASTRRVTRTQGGTTLPGRGAPGVTAPRCGYACPWRATRTDALPAHSCNGPGRAPRRADGPGTRKRGVHEHGSAPRLNSPTPADPTPPGHPAPPGPAARPRTARELRPSLRDRAIRRHRTSRPTRRTSRRRPRPACERRGQPPAPRTSLRRPGRRRAAAPASDDRSAARTAGRSVGFGPVADSGQSSRPGQSPMPEQPPRPVSRRGPTSPPVDRCRPASLRLRQPASSDARTGPSRPGQSAEAPASHPQGRPFAVGPDQPPTVASPASSRPDPSSAPPWSRAAPPCRRGPAPGAAPPPGGHRRRGQVLPPARAIGRPAPGGRAPSDAPAVRRCPVASAPPAGASGGRRPVGSPPADGRRPRRGTASGRLRRSGIAAPEGDGGPRSSGADAGRARPRVPSPPKSFDFFDFSADAEAPTPDATRAPAPSPGAAPPPRGATPAIPGLRPPGGPTRCPRPRRRPPHGSPTRPGAR